MKVIFVCTGNSCRSQMAEGWMRHLSHGEITTASAGIETHGLSPNAVKTMGEAGVDISQHRSKLLTDEILEGANLVVTVCGDADENCPLLPPGTQKIHWPISDPDRVEGSETEVHQAFVESRDALRQRVEKLVEAIQQGAYQ